jgi:hypothetical protein
MERHEVVLDRRDLHQFLTQDEGPERIEAALGKSLRRLAEVKARWDPENVFRANRNILPGSQSPVTSRESGVGSRESGVGSR